MSKLDNIERALPSSGSKSPVALPTSTQPMRPNRPLPITPSDETDMDVPGDAHPAARMPLSRPMVSQPKAATVPSAPSSGGGFPKPERVTSKSTEAIMLQRIEEAPKSTAVHRDDLLTINVTIKLDKNTMTDIDRVAGSRATNAHTRESVAYAMKHVSVKEIREAASFISEQRRFSPKTPPATPGPGRVVTVGVSESLYRSLQNFGGDALSPKAIIEGSVYIYTRRIIDARNAARK